MALRSGAWLTSPAGGVPHLAGLPAQHVTRAHGDRRNGAIHRLEERSRRRTPGARAVMDLFHVTHPAGDALDECRRRIGQERHQRRGRPYRPHGDRHTGQDAQAAIQRYPGLLRPPPHHRRSHRSHQRPPRTPTQIRTRTCETSPTTSPEHSSKQEDSDPNYTPNYEEPLFPVDLDAPYRQSQRPRGPPRSPSAHLLRQGDDRGR